MNTKQKKLSIALISIIVIGGLTTGGILYYNNVQEQKSMQAAEQLRQAEMRIPKAPTHINIRPSYRKTTPALTNYVKEMANKDRSLTPAQRQALIKSANDYHNYKNLQAESSQYLKKIDQMGKKIKLMTIQDQFLKQQATLAQTRINTMEQNTKLQAAIDQYKPQKSKDPMQAANVSMIASTNHGFIAKLTINNQSVEVHPGDMLSSHVKVSAIQANTVTLIDTLSHQTRLLSV